MRRRIAIAVILAGLLVPAPALAAPGWTWPVDGEVITPYRNGADPYAGGQHRGIDVTAAVGTPVRAAAAGTVTFSGTAGSSGLTVAVRTADGRFDTSYLHLSGASVAKGERVAAGARLGAVGTSGKRSAAAPHLHFGIREAGRRHAYRDPLTLLPPAGAPVREAPRGVPAPVPAPVRAVPRPERAPRRLRSPRRVPAGRRVRIPASRRLPRPVPRRPLAAPRPVMPLRAPRGARRPAPGRAPSPRLGPRPVATPAPVERQPVARRGPEPAVPTPGRDFGMAAACVGLLLAAACLGGRTGATTPARRASLRSLLRPLTGRQ